jgi:hypothetical protein
VDPSKSSTAIEKAGQLPQIETLDDDLPTGRTRPTPAENYIIDFLSYLSQFREDFTPVRI